MKTTWSWSAETEANRIINTAKSIASGFFHFHHFYPLPWQPGKTYLPQGVYLPRLNYLDYPQFWRHCQQFNTKTLIVEPQLYSLQTFLVQEITKLGLTSPDYSQLKKDWERLSPRFNALVKNLLPYAPSIANLEIHPSYFGTMGSFNLLQKEENTVIVELRVDAQLSKIAECILTSITRPYLYAKHSSTWEESEFLVDYLLQETALAKLFPVPHLGTLVHLRSYVPARVISDSSDFLAQIHAPTPTKQSFSLRKQKIYFGPHQVVGLSAREYLVLAKLIEKSPLPITIDELADLIFTDPNKFTLAGITKFVERLRHKLESIGISRYYLATASGVGYYLKN